MNDGNGEQTVAFDYAFKTLPYIDVTECSIANTSAVSEGETIFMSVNLDNPLGMTIESVVINGETYNVTGASTKNKIFVEIVYNGQFAGGDTYLKIDKVNAKIDNTTLSIEPKSEISDNVFINGKLEVVKIEFVNEEFEPIDWAFPSDTVYVLITLNNPTGYNVDYITESGSKSEGTVTNLKKLDNNHWYYELDFVVWIDGKPVYDVSYNTVGWFAKNLESLAYSNNYITKTVTYSEMIAYFYRVKSDEVHYISTPDDLKNMADQYYYELKNDIDLSGLEWHGSEFDGVFDGKGYSIENMSFVGTIKNVRTYFGLFAEGKGVIHNVNIKEATIIAEITADDGYTYNAYCGGFVGHNTYTLYIRGCSVDESSVINIKNYTGGITYAGGLIGSGESGTIAIIDSINSGSVSANSSYETCAGGLIGQCNTITIINSNNSGSISATTDYVGYAGGLIGHNTSNAITITDSGNSGSITSSGYAGGLVGASGIYFASTVTITGSTNSGSVTTTKDYYVGGLVGSSQTITITDSSNSGSITGSSYTGGLVGYSSTITITNSTNSGSITSSSGAGGLVGSSQTITITDSSNIGSITSSDCAGGLVGSSQTITITNSTNSGRITSSSGAGGLVGHGATTTIKNSGNSGSISVTTDFFGYAGGLIGEGSEITIINSGNSGSVTASSNPGGLVGYGGTITITSSTNSGSVSANTDYYGAAGGLVGYGGTITITNSTNSGRITSSSGAGGLVGHGATTTITNSYSLFSGNGYNGEACTIEQLDSREFYTETLGWSEDIWDFSELDIENGKYPKLK